ncbi:MAG: acetyl-CoA carboxylase biotin carboxylase subunit [Saprospiraceae bacterium]|nr:acetyl-CoA carboxylase biotin carboxylase subunit [Saprospiraceae bacterium]
MIKKILIANRGEIARRIIRTAKEMGIRSVAIYSDADRQALHRFDADESYEVGPAPSAQSYLNQKKVIEIAIESGCDAIHPGYGFLSENAAFAKKVEEANLIFIGPSPESIRLMGDKLAAKELARQHGVPLLPGTPEPVQDVSEGKATATSIGYPVLLKAAGGGGGKGMRAVYSEKEFDAYFEMASSEAQQSFGDPRVFIEKYLEAPKHIEIQIMGDQQGNIVHIFERDCSVQRRHQKVVEESPGPTMTPPLRARMTEAAVRLAKACHYIGAGTVEFLVDSNQEFYFLEMNTRLQVEHPVTECISGLDLVRWQIDVANGLPLPLAQNEIKMRGHSIQLRVYAEEWQNNFAPSMGRINYYKEPQHPQVRIDGAAFSGYEVPLYYDSMLAKLIVWGKDRREAIANMLEAIKAYQILGIDTTLVLGLFVFSQEQFIKGDYNTHFLKDHFHMDQWREELQPKARVASYLAAYLHRDFLEKPQENLNSDSWRKARL